MTKYMILPVVVVVASVLLMVGSAHYVLGDDSSVQLQASGTIGYDATVSYVMHGGFINPKFSNVELNVTPDMKTYIIYDSDGNITRKISMPIDSAEYTQLVDTLNSNDFMALNDIYNINLPDVGTSQISVMGQGIDKTVSIVNMLSDISNATPGGSASIPPENLAAVISELGNISGSITNPDVPDFTLYGYDTIYSMSIPANGSSYFTAGPFTFNISNGTFSDDVQVNVLQADPSMIAAYAPNGEVPVQAFALRVQDVNNGSIITDFTSPISVTVNDGNITSDAAFYDVSPDDTYNSVGGSFTADSGVLTATLDSARNAWAITEPASVIPNVSSPNVMGNENIVYSLKSSATWYGHILVDSSGMSLYTFASDMPYTSTCYGQCATVWPPMISSSGNVPNGLNLPEAGTLGVMLRQDGQYQVVYNGEPLYYFTKDTQPGDTNGNGIYAFNATWSLVYLDSPYQMGSASQPTVSSSQPMIPASQSGSSSSSY